MSEADTHLVLNARLGGISGIRTPRIS
jgi:hypothetical protein